MSLFSCRRAAELTSKELDAPLGMREKIALGAHRLICSACRRFHGQIVRVDQSVESFVSGEDETADSRLSDSARQRIREELARLTSPASEPPGSANEDASQ